MTYLSSWSCNAPAVTPCRKLEDALDQKMAELISLRKAAVEHAAGSPVKSAPLQSALGAWGNAGRDQCGHTPSVDQSSIVLMGIRRHSDLTLSSL